MQYFLLILVILITLGLISYWIHFLRKFAKVREGMNYQEVISIMGSPKIKNTIDRVTVYTWRIHPLRGVYITREVFFKDGIVVRKSKG